MQSSHGLICGHLTQAFMGLLVSNQSARATWRVCVTMTQQCNRASAASALTQDIDHSRYALTDESVAYVTAGSPEAQVFYAVPAEGMSMAELKASPAGACAHAAACAQRLPTGHMLPVVPGARHMLQHAPAAAQLACVQAVMMHAARHAGHACAFHACTRAAHRLTHASIAMHLHAPPCVRAGQDARRGG